MRALTINYPKTKDDLDKLDYLTRNYHAMLEKSIKAEGRLIRLECISKDEMVNHKATVSVQMN